MGILLLSRMTYLNAKDLPKLGRKNRVDRPNCPDCKGGITMRANAVLSHLPHPISMGDHYQCDQIFCTFGNHLKPAATII